MAPTVAAQWPSGPRQWDSAEVFGATSVRQSGFRCWVQTSLGAYSAESRASDFAIDIDPVACFATIEKVSFCHTLDRKQPQFLECFTVAIFAGLVPTEPRQVLFALCVATPERVKTERIIECSFVYAFCGNDYQCYKKYARLQAYS